MRQLSQTKTDYFKMLSKSSFTTGPGFDIVWPNIQSVSLNKSCTNKLCFLVFQLTTFS